MLKLQKCLALTWLAAGSAFATPNEIVVDMGTPAESTTIALTAENLVGAFDYQGGFAPRLMLALKEPQMITSFRLDMPKFCQDVEILEAGSRAENNDELAVNSQKDPNVFLVNGGKGQRVNALFVSLNGPDTSRCKVPVFAENAPAAPQPIPVPPATALSGSFIFENGNKALVFDQQGTLLQHGFVLINNHTGRVGVTTFNRFFTATNTGFMTRGLLQDDLQNPRGAWVRCQFNIFLSLDTQADSNKLTARLNVPTLVAADNRGRCYEYRRGEHFFNLTRDLNLAGISSMVQE